MKFTSSAMKTAIGATGIAAAAVLTAATAAAVNPTTQPFGTSEQLVDGPLVTAYTVSNLQPSNVTLPVVGPQGQIWQADVTATANSGTVTPLISDFNARSADGTNYRVIEEGTPNGISPSPIAQGQQSTGKIYFNVTGTPPNSVVYNDGVEDVLIWTTAAGTGQGNAPATGQGNAAGTGQGNGAGTGQGNTPGAGQGNTPGTGDGNAPAVTPGQ